MASPHPARCASERSRERPAPARSARRGELAMRTPLRGGVANGAYEADVSLEAATAKRARPGGQRPASRPCPPARSSPRSAPGVDRLRGGVLACVACASPRSNRSRRTPSSGMRRGGSPTEAPRVPKPLARSSRPWATGVIAAHPDRVMVLSAREIQRALDPTAPPPAANPAREVDHVRCQRLPFAAASSRHAGSLDSDHRGRGSVCSTPRLPSAFPWPTTKP